MKKNFFLFLLIIMICLTACSGGKSSDPKGEQIRVIHAGSLSVPFQKMARAFEERYPHIDVLLESHGSRTCARQISDLKKEFDVFGSADSAVIQNLLIPEHADFSIDFTTNEMVIMMSPHSRGIDEIGEDNWMDVLLRPGIQYGHSDPNSDPCGYRTLLMWKLAAIHYRRPDLFQRLTEKMPRKNIRSKEVDLIALLEAGELDYIFIYRSVAEQHRSRYIRLPDQINLGSSEFASLYRKVSIKITGRTPGQWLTKHGAPMVYGLTIPKNAPNPAGGEQFVAFILGETGKAIMSENGQPLLTPPKADHPEKLPARLKGYFKK